MNRRICYALTQATGVDCGEDPEDWQQWWNGHVRHYYEREEPYDYARPRASSYDYEQPKPVYESRSYGTRYYASATAPRNPYGPSCFSAHTPVWTLTGPVAIEDVKVGDRVLSQSVETGELTYKPVLEKTLRDPSPMIDIALGSETISATRGHPFWVAGEGWRMAKELGVGSMLHGVSGAVPIGSLEENPPAEPWLGHAHNLVVDGFHTYFVGDRKLLVHDNTSFDPKPRPVPGF